jgi:cell division transport system permease protein
VLGFLVTEAARDLRRAGRVALSAVLLITLALAALGAFWMVTSNLGDAVQRSRDRVRIIVYLESEPSADALPALLSRVQAVPGVASASYVSRSEALASLRRILGKDAAVVDHLAANPLSASIEITPAASAATPEAAREMLRRLAALPEVDEVAGSADWVERFSEWQRLLALIGLGIGAVLTLAAILTVTTATTLVLHARRQETEIMRLVGAPEFAIRLPLLLQGLIQGLLGALLALLALRVAHHVAAPWLEPLTSLTIGLPRLEFLTPPGMLLLVAAGAGLGALGGWLARGRRSAM